MVLQYVWGLQPLRAFPAQSVLQCLVVSHKIWQKSSPRCEHAHTSVADSALSRAKTIASQMSNRAIVIARSKSSNLSHIRDY